MKLVLAVGAASVAGAQEVRAPAADPSRTNTVRWVVRGGSTSFAYEVFRGETEAGPFIKANRDLISGHVNKQDESVKAFEFVDTEIDPRKDYWYYVETINLMGVRERLTPIRKAPAKVAASPAPAPKRR